MAPAVRAAANLLRRPSNGRGSLQLADDGRQGGDEPFAVMGRQRLKNAAINALRQRFRRAQHLSAGVRQPHGVGARILLGAPALQEPFSLQAAHEVGHRRAVDSRAINEFLSG